MGPKRRYRIVIALDGSQYSEIVLEHAFDQAARHESPDLHLVTIVNNTADADVTKQWLARTTLEGLDAFSGHRDTWRTRLHVRVGKPEVEIPNLAAEVDANLLVIGNFGVHAQRRPIAERVLERATCPTLILGLTGRVVEANPQCPDCVTAREVSDGERWFCEEHTSDVRLRMSTLLPASMPLSRGGTLW
jgi:nucleotide-binding universal stress UspA family protein